MTSTRTLDRNRPFLFVFAWSLFGFWAHVLSPFYLDMYFTHVITTNSPDNMRRPTEKACQVIVVMLDFLMKPGNETVPASPKLQGHCCASQY